MVDVEKGGGSGKTAYAMRKIIEYAFAHPGQRVFVIRSCTGTFEESNWWDLLYWQELMKQIETAYPGRYEVDGPKLTIKCDNGSEIRVET